MIANECTIIVECRMSICFLLYFAIVFLINLFNKLVLLVCCISLRIYHIETRHCLNMCLSRKITHLCCTKVR